MSKIKGRDTGPEVRLRKALWKAGLRYRTHYELVGKPDIVFVGKRTVVFVDGCFWHRCPLHSTKPKSNSEFWKIKLSRNVRRDNEVNEQLARAGWKVLRFWEHEVNDNLEGLVRTIKDCLKNE